MVRSNPIMITFSELIDELKNNINNNKSVLVRILKDNPNTAYQRVNELARFTGNRHNVDLRLHFPASEKIFDVDSYGTENIGVVIDKNRKTFPIPRDVVKKEAYNLIGQGIEAHDAYMYEGKEGVKIKLQLNSGKLEVLPGSIHFWCKIETPLAQYGDWLMKNVYFRTTTS
ncbi:MAG TPA: hypothetical protein VE089_10715 [Nitrososphaeraceae archaeon]|nr:hypothetical protein [Nitrososphaeraceae archaeon]